MIGINELVVWIILGAIGGFLHYIIPYPKEEKTGLKFLIKRIIAGAIVVPLIMGGGYQFLPQNLYIGGYFGEVIAGYFALDIISLAIKHFQSLDEEVGPDV